METNSFHRNAHGNLIQGPVTFVANSQNEKIVGYKGGRVATTYVSIKASCPDTCSMKADGTCYAQGGMVGMQVRRIEARSPRATSAAAAQIEAKLIRAAFKGGDVPQDGAHGGRDLRIHTSGDCRTPSAAWKVGRAATDWRNRRGGAAWTYTHAWKAVPRHEWGRDVSVLASVDNATEATEARSQGYAPAMVVAEFPNGSKMFESEGMRWVPCPAQTRENVGCADCRLCMNADKLFNRDTGIAFEAHGNKTAQLKRKLQVVS